MSNLKNGSLEGGGQVTEEGNDKRKRKRSKRKKDMEKQEKEDEKRQGKKISIDTNKKPKNGNENKMWGDEMTRNNKWPTTMNNTLRILGQNIKGISYYNDYIAWQYTLDQLDAMQIDVGCFSEINLDLNNKAVQYELMEKAKRMDRQISQFNSRFAKNEDFNDVST